MAKSNNYFDDSLFQEEISQEPELINIKSDDEEPVEETFQDAIKEPISDDFLEMGKMFIGFVDESRAIGASLISGEPKEKYLFYKDAKTGKLSNDNELVIAAAKVAQKYQFKFGPEVVLILGLLLSTGLTFKKAINDSKKAKKDSKKPTETVSKEIE